jgi:hypothetical protein
VRNLIFGGFLVSFGLSLSSLICLVFISLGLSDYRFLNPQQTLGVQSAYLAQADLTPGSANQTVIQEQGATETPSRFMQVSIYIVILAGGLLLLKLLLTYKKKLKLSVTSYS